MNGENYCPVCKRDMLNYDSFVLESTEQGYYPFTCPTCGTNGKEWFELNYVESTTSSKKGGEESMGK